MERAEPEAGRGEGLGLRQGWEWRREGRGGGQASFGSEKQCNILQCFRHVAFI